MRAKLMRFLQGRYGRDELSQCMVWIAILLVLADSFLKSNFLYFIGLAFAILAYARILSRNYAKRAGENQVFLNRTWKIRLFFQKIKKDAVTRKTHHIYICSNCRQKIRIPRGKGKIMVRCPKCGNQFRKNS